MKRSTILVNATLATILVAVALVCCARPSTRIMPVPHPTPTATPIPYVCVVVFGPAHVGGTQAPGEVLEGHANNGQPVYIKILDEWRVPASQLDSNGRWGLTGQYVQAPDEYCDAVQAGIG